MLYVVIFIIIVFLFMGGMGTWYDEQDKQKANAYLAHKYDEEKKKKKDESIR